MTTYVYFCVTDQEIADAKAACTQHECDQIQEFGPGKALGYEGDMEPLFDAKDATVVVGLKQN